jgi:hypothetical protein
LFLERAPLPVMRSPLTPEDVKAFCDELSERM